MLPFSQVLLLTLAVMNGTAADQDVWSMQVSNVSASLRGLCVVDAQTVWASGSQGTVIKTADGGKTWVNVSVKAAPQLDFRDLHAFDSRRAVVLSAGQPARIYRTTDGGQNWKLSFEHSNKKSFFDALSFANSQYGIAMSDPVDDRVLLIETHDGGATWTELSPQRRPKVIRGEAGFAASGTNMRIVGDRILIALGGAEKGKQHKESRIVFSDDQANTWQVAMVPMPRNESSGIFSMHFVDQQHGVVVGGNYQKPDQRLVNVSITLDGGKSWELTSGTPPFGYRSGVAHYSSKQRSILVAVGPNGTDLSMDFGRKWKKASKTGFHAVAFTADGKSGWATGANGQIATWNPDHLDD